MNGRVALVTGGSRGIGREAALLLSAAGARVMVVARSEMELASVGLEHVAADLGTREGCALAVAETERRLGPIDVLVVNHGIGSAHERLVWEQDPEVWRETMRVNLDGPFELARLTVGGMCKRRFGRLVFTSSTAGEKAERSGSAYTASKQGVMKLTESMAEELKGKVRVNAVLPSTIDTPANRKDMPKADFSTWVTPTELADVMLFLASDAASAVTGALIPVVGRV